KCLRIPYDASAKAPTWKSFLWRVMGAPLPDEEGTEEALLERHERAERLVSFLQRSVGYALTGRTHEDCLFILYGSGRNGKSVFLDALKALLCDYAKTAQMTTFLHQDRETVRNDLADLKGVRLVTAIETTQGSRFSEGLIKQLTGGDHVKARFLFHEYFEFLPNFKLFLAFNHRPTITGTDRAIWERVRTIPFDVFIPAEQRDPYLSEKLKAELPGILAWAVEGCMAWQREGLNPPPEVRQATEEYRLDMDRVGRFLADACLISPQVSVQAGALYDAYKVWCAAEGEEAMNQTMFGRQLTERGFMQEKRGGKKWRLGLALTKTEDA
ncbi:MAG TPA: phage/plasmid primase, P4 family, partial [Nitrospiraceae bacterium]|nr:phage/plasmid primase, P4 family [Nitrospiraceae bacterium]